MTTIKHYEDVLEAIGILGSESKINNMLNTVYSRTKDHDLRDMVGDILLSMRAAGLNHAVLTLRNSNAVKTKQVESYCRGKLGFDPATGPMSVE